MKDSRRFHSCKTTCGDHWTLLDVTEHNYVLNFARCVLLYTWFNHFVNFFLQYFFFYRSTPEYAHVYSFGVLIVSLNEPHRAFFFNAAVAIYNGDPLNWLQAKACAQYLQNRFCDVAFVSMKVLCFQLWLVLRQRSRLSGRSTYSLTQESLSVMKKSLKQR